MKTDTKKQFDWEKEFLKIIHDYMTFGAMDDPENFEPYISFDRKYDFTNFMIKVRRLNKSLLSTTRKEVIDDLIKKLEEMKTGNYVRDFSKDFTLRFAAQQVLVDIEILLSKEE